jgi:hypothetical protein
MCITQVMVQVGLKLEFYKLDQIMHVERKRFGPRGLCDTSDK